MQWNILILIVFTCFWVIFILGCKLLVKPKSFKWKFHRVLIENWMSPNRQLILCFLVRISSNRGQLYLQWYFKAMKFCKKKWNLNWEIKLRHRSETRLQSVSCWLLFLPLKLLIFTSPPPLRLRHLLHMFCVPGTMPCIETLEVNKAVSDF